MIVQTLLFLSSSKVMLLQWSCSQKTNGKLPTPGFLGRERRREVITLITLIFFRSKSGGGGSSNNLASGGVQDNEGVDDDEEEVRGAAEVFQVRRRRQ